MVIRARSANSIRDRGRASHKVRMYGCNLNPRLCCHKLSARQTGGVHVCERTAAAKPPPTRFHHRLTRRQRLLSEIAPGSIQRAATSSGRCALQELTKVIRNRCNTVQLLQVLDRVQCSLSALITDGFGEANIAPILTDDVLVCYRVFRPAKWQLVALRFQDSAIFEMNG